MNNNGMVSNSTTSFNGAHTHNIGSHTHNIGTYNMYFKVYTFNSELILKTKSYPPEMINFTGFITDDNENEFVYFMNGERHKENHPAYSRKYDDGTIYRWYFRNKDYTKEVDEFLKNNNLNWKDMTDDEFDMLWTCIL